MRLGIDFGTCYSSAALLLEGIPTPIPAPLTPGYSLASSVFIPEQGEILVGQAAENKRQKEPQRYKREFKRELGSPDPYALGNTFMLPEELVSEVLKKLKTEAEKVAQGRGISSLTDVVMTVPATYTSYKRQLMEDAAKNAGFIQIKLLEEPVAAAMYYSCHAQIKDGDLILVYDFGGGTFDATLMQKQGDKYQFLGMPKGLANCGGTDCDHLIYQHLKTECSAELRQQLDAKNAWRTKAIVGDFCRDLKHQLSEQTEASIYIPMGLGEVESFELTRDIFNGMIASLIEETLDCCEQLVRSAGKDWNQVSQMLLVGGSSRIPYVKEAIEKRFKIHPFLVDKPELAVCLGATISDSISSSKPENEIREQQEQEIKQAFEKREAEIKAKAENEIREQQEQEIKQAFEEREAEIKAKAENEIREQQEQEIKQAFEEREAEIKAKAENEIREQQEQEIKQAFEEREAEIKAKAENERKRKEEILLRREVQSQEVQHIDLKKTKNSERYLEELLDTLNRQKFNIRQNFDVYDQKPVYIVEGILEHKAIFGLIGKLRLVLCLSEFDHLSFDIWENFSSTCKRYTIQKQLIYPVKSFEKGYYGCLLSPVAIVKYINFDLVQRVKKVSPKAESPDGPMILPSIYEVGSQLFILPEGFHWVWHVGWDAITNSLRHLLVK